MPELPDVTVYIEALRPRVVGQPLQAVRIASPFLLRTFDPPLSVLEGQPIEAVHRLGKRIIFDFPGELHLVLHLMIAGRLHWRRVGAKLGGKVNLAAFDFPAGSLVLTEASPKKRVSLHLVRGADALAEFRRSGIEPLEANVADFAAALRRENHTVKRSLSDPRLFSGIGNAYSDEILHRGGFSPLALSQKLTDDEVARLHQATREVLIEWIDRLRAETGDGFPEGVAAFRPEMAVHGKFGQPCPVCQAPVQRIRYADKETNYCPRCQTKGKILADRSLSRLLKGDWPRTLEELEEG